jgi:hypothetical protein
VNHLREQATDVPRRSESEGGNVWAPLLTRWETLRSALGNLVPTGRDRLSTIVAWAAGIACVLAIWQRFHYSADLSDETFSIALPYRFALGDKPFVDEISIQQTAGVVLFPFVWLFVKVTGGSTGIVLFVRAVHLLFKAIAAFGVHAAARRLLRSPAAAVAVSFVPFAFVPHSIPNVGYNVIGLSLMTAGAFLTVAGLVEPDRKNAVRLFFLAGLAEGIMAFAYPPMGIAAVLAAPIVFASTPSRRLASTGAFVAGGVAAIVLVSPSLAFGGIQGLRRSLGWGVHAAETHTSTRLIGVVEGLWRAIPTFYPYALVALGIAWLFRTRALTAVLVSAVTLAIAVWFRDESASAKGAIHTVTYAGIFAPALILVAKPDSVLLRATALVVLPSWAAAVAASFVSTQGIDAAALPLTASLVLFALLAARAIENVGGDPTLTMLPAVALMVVLVTRTYDFVYRDAPMAQLTEKVAGGPFKGIRTTPDRARMFSELSQITQLFDRPDGRILFLYEAPGLYLFSRMRPSAHCVWQTHNGDQTGLLSYWQQSYAKGHGIVVRLKGTATGSIDRVVAPAERRLMETAHFIVYRDQG